ncbi:hypothetical protein BLOT_005601 [Blomia tropicalis]|nr:hypothetical protein BLOT_005601 [Blomia tropicalis]
MPGENQLMLVIRTDSNYNGIHIYVMNRSDLVNQKSKRQLIDHEYIANVGKSDRTIYFGIE